MENTNSIELYNKAVKEYKELTRLNLERIKSIYPDAEIITEEDAFLHIMHNSESLEDAFERITANYPKDQISVNARIAWNRFNQTNRNTDFLERETFELFFNNEYNFLLQSGKTNGLKSIEAVHKVFLRLHEIYNKRFIENEPIYDNIEEDFTKVLYLHELGVIDHLRAKYKGLSNPKIGKILQPLIQVKPDTIRKYLDRIARQDIPNYSETNVNNYFNIFKIKLD